MDNPNQFPTSSRLAKHAERNGKPNAAQAAAQTAGKANVGNSKPAANAAQTQPKAPCSCNH